MVSFSCQNCGDVLTKKKLDPHRNQCRGACYTCLDCMVDFQGTEYRAHTSCISEAQKYQGALYRGEGKGKKGKQSILNRNNNSANLQPVASHKAYVEDVPDGYDSQLILAETSIPEAPTPPSAVPFNVFDFLVDETPNASRSELPTPDEVMNDSEPERQPEHEYEIEQQLQDETMSDDADISEVDEQPSMDLVRVHFEETNQSLTGLVEYGNGPIPSGEAAIHTPAPKAIEWQPKEHKKDSKKKEKDGEKKKDKNKKRKRLHVDTHDLSSREGDAVMTDAPPVLHSGLTGGLGKLLSRPSVFPPSPDYSGGDVAGNSPESPIKKKKEKHEKRSSRSRKRSDTLTSNFMALIGTRQTSRENSEDRPKKRKHRSHHSTERPVKMLEYKPMANGKDESASGEHQMVVYKPRAELLMSFVNKGPTSQKGVSMNKALKRYHRERTANGLALGKNDEEKELWRSLRMKKNDRGEIVLFMG